MEHAKATSSSKKSSKNKVKRSLHINPARLQLETRWLPPGHMLDYYDQMKIAEEGLTPVSFACFWRTWLREFPHLKFRSESSHAMCTVCLRHKLLLRQFASHLRARESQKRMYIDHLKAQFADRGVYYSLRGDSRLRGSPTIVLMTDSMDQCKFIYPRAGALFRSKELSTMIRPKAHITGILCHGFFFMISVSAQDLRKDSSTMVELLARCLTILVDDFSVDLTRASGSVKTISCYSGLPSLSPTVPQPRCLECSPQHVSISMGIDLIFSDTWRNLNQMSIYQVFQRVLVLGSQGITHETAIQCLRSGHSHEDLVGQTPGPERQ